MSGFVYFIRPIGFEGPVKVGFTASLKKRLSSLEQACPFPLEIIAQLPGDRELERRFHAFFGLSYMKREWFDWSPKMADIVQRINDGTFETAELPGRNLPIKKARPIAPPFLRLVHTDGSIETAPLKTVRLSAGVTK